jgi:hypothetical protein
MVAYIAAYMHQDGRMWEAVWLKGPVNVPGLEIALAEDIAEVDSASSETSELRRSTSKSELELTAIASPVEGLTRTPLQQRKEQTWDLMSQYIKGRAELEETEMPFRTLHAEKYRHNNRHDNVRTLVEYFNGFSRSESSCIFPFNNIRATESQISSVSRFNNNERIAL